MTCVNLRQNVAGSALKVKWGVRLIFGHLLYRYVEDDRKVQPEELGEERVVYGEEVRLYRGRVVLAYFDSPAYDFSMADILIPPEVRVLNEEGVVIGYARVETEKTAGGVGRMVADVSIDYHCPERLLAEQREVWAVPDLVVESDPYVTNFKQPPVVLQVALRGIWLARTKLPDDRIAPLGSPVF